MMRFIEFTAIEFEGVDGTIHTFFGCSLAGQFEFEERLRQIEAMLSEVSGSKTWQQLYIDRKQFRHLVNRCLKLNGIKPEWVNLDMTEQLLFCRQEGEEWKPGFLVELNQPRQVSTNVEKGKATITTAEQAIAALSLQLGSLTEALEVANNLPAKQTLAIATARAELSKSGEDKRKAEFNDWAQQQRAQMRQRREAV